MSLIYPDLFFCYFFSISALFPNFKWQIFNIYYTTNSMVNGTRRFNTAFTKAPPIIPILSRINPFPRIYTYICKILFIFSSHLRPGLPKGLFPVCVPVKIEITSIFFHFDYMTCLSQSSRLNHPDYFSERYNLWSSSMWSLIYFPFSSPLGPNIRLKILFSNTLSLRSSLNTSLIYSNNLKVILSYIRRWPQIRWSYFQFEQKLLEINKEVWQAQSLVHFNINEEIGLVTSTQRSWIEAPNNENVFQLWKPPWFRNIKKTGTGYSFSSINLTICSDATGITFPFKWRMSALLFSKYLMIIQQTILHFNLWQHY